MSSASLITAFGIVYALWFVGGAYIYVALLRQIGARRSTSSDEAPAPFGLPEAILAAFLILWFLALAAVSISNPSVELTDQGVIGSLVMTLGIVSGIVGLFKLRGRNVEVLAGFSKLGAWRAIATGVILLIFAYPLISLADVITQQFLHNGSSKQSIVELFNSSQTIGQRIIIIVFAVSIAPAAEEFIFRFFLYGVLKRYFGYAFGLVANALLFAAVHGHLPSFAALFVLGSLFHHRLRMERLDPRLHDDARALQRGHARLSRVSETVSAMKGLSATAVLRRARRRSTARGVASLIVDPKRCHRRRGRRLRRRAIAARQKSAPAQDRLRRRENPFRIVRRSCRCRLESNDASAERFRRHVRRAAIRFGNAHCSRRKIDKLGGKRFIADWSAPPRALTSASSAAKRATRADPPRFSVSVAGFVERDRWVSRRGGKVGDDLFVTGKLGRSIRGKHLRFIPRIAEARWLTKNFPIHAMMDLSDGLGADLPRLAKASKVGFKIDMENLPLNPGAKIDNAISDGEDYELLFAISPRHREHLKRSWREKFPKSFSLTRIGRLHQPSTISHQPPLPRGYLHFQ